MSDVVLVAAVYGPAQRLGLVLHPDGAHRFTLGGNTPPLFPLAELGAWAGTDPAAGATLFNDVVSVLPRSVGVRTLPPDAAYIDVCHERDGAVLTRRTFALYDPSAPWDVVQRALLDAVHGPWLAGRARTLAADARWEREPLEAPARPALVVALRATGTQPASVPSLLDPERWTLTLVPAGATPAELEDYPTDVTPDEYALTAVSAGLVPADSYQRVAPGSAAEVRFELRRPLPVGQWFCTVRFTAPEPGWGPKRADLVTGALTLDLPVLEVIPAR